MVIMPGMGFEAVQNMDWPEMKEWHRNAVETWKLMRGCN
jgi:hypothetical protein